PRGGGATLAKHGVGWARAPWRSWPAPRGAPPRPPPGSGGRRGGRVARAPPPPAGEGGTACEASGGVGAGSLTKLVGAAHAPPPGLPASGGRSGWRAVGAGPLRASGAVWGGSESRGGFAAAGAPSPLPPLARSE